MNLIFGVGINDRKVPIFINGKIVRSYSVWHSMLRRCYSEVYQKSKPSYIGCSTSDNFKNYSFFREWAEKQKGWEFENWHLDKDILGDSKTYSETNCVFIPPEINCLFLKGNKLNCNNELPLGVSYKVKNRKYVAQCRQNNKESHLGLFDSADDAHRAYTKAKSMETKRLLDIYRENLDERVIIKLESLIN